MIVDLNELSGDDSQVIEISHRICFCPQAHFACVLEGFVLDFVQLFAIEIDYELLALRRHAQSAPLSRRNFHFLSVCAAFAFERQISAFAVLDLVEHDVIFERVGTHDVVVIGVLETPDQPGGLIPIA
jgi:hypothetical protein